MLKSYHSFMIIKLRKVLILFHYIVFLFEHVLHWVECVCFRFSLFFVYYLVGLYLSALCICCFIRI